MSAGLQPVSTFCDLFVLNGNYCRQASLISYNICSIDYLPQFTQKMHMSLLILDS